MDDVATMDVTCRHIVGDISKLIYFFEADDGSGVALQGDRGPSGVKKAIEDGKARLAFKVSMGSVVSEEKRAHKVMLQIF